MKKLAMVLALGVLLSGCGMSCSRYTKLVARCEGLGGTPIVYKTDEGMPWKVRCQIADMVFMQGDY